MNNEIILFEKYLKESEKSDNTINKYLRDIKEFQLWLLKVSDVRYSETSVNGREETQELFCMSKLYEPIVTKEILINYKEYLKMSQLKVSSINSKISSLNAFFAYTDNKSLKLKGIRLQKSLFASKEKELTRYEFNKLYDVVKRNYRLKYLIETIVNTGVRVSELKYITVESLDIGKAVVDNKGKTRIILIPIKLCNILKNYCKMQCINSGPIFLTRNHKPLDRKQIWQMMKKLAEKSGIPKVKVYPHNLRHLFAREFYRTTHDIAKLASILGHSSIETTRIYTMATEEDCRFEIDRIYVNDSLWK